MGGRGGGIHMWEGGGYSYVGGRGGGYSYVGGRGVFICRREGGGGIHMWSVIGQNPHVSLRCVD